MWVSYRHHPDLRRRLTCAIEVDLHLQLTVVLLERSPDRFKAPQHPSIRRTRLSQETPR